MFNYPLKKQLHKLEECADEVGAGKMPLDSYTWVHAEAKLDDAQRKKLVDWFNSSPNNSREED